MAELAIPCVEGALGLADVYADTDVAPPPADLVADVDSTSTDSTIS